MNRTKKEDLSVELKEKLERAKVALFADYKGLSAPQADELRKQLRKENAEAKVLKNNVARIISRDGQFGDEVKDVMDKMVGPTLVAFAYGDPAAAAKVMHKFSQGNEAFKLKESLMGRKRLDVSGVEELAQLPPKDVLVAKLLGTMNAPITNFVGVLAAVPRGLVTVLSEIEKKKADPSA